MFMQASVLDVQWGRLLVLDLLTRQRVIVNTPDARFFRPGDLVQIWYSGVMTNSIPPQITALSIAPLSPGGVPPVIVPPVVRPPIVVVPPFFPRPRPPVGGPGRPGGGRPPRPPHGGPGGRPPRGRR